MKIKLIFVFLISLFSFTAYAACNDHMHCTRLKGLSSIPSEGRIIKAVTSHYTLMGCVNDNTSLIPIDTTRNPLDYTAGNAEITFYLCDDASGDHCTLIGSDKFLYSAESYRGDFQPVRTSTPQTTTLSLPSRLIKQLPSCSVSTTPAYRSASGH